MPVCPLCNQPVPVNRGEDPNNKVTGYKTWFHLYSLLSCLILEGYAQFCGLVVRKSLKPADACARILSVFHAM